MEHLTPPLLTAIRELRWQIRAGRSARDAAEDYLSTHNDGFSLKIRELILLREQNSLNTTAHYISNPYHIAFWDLIDRGLRGHPIDEPLGGLELEVERATQMDIDTHIATLPFKALLPLLFFHFPAFLLLLVVPLLRDLNL